MKILWTILLTLIVPVSAFSHEYWFEPDNFFMAPKEKSVIRLFAGEPLKKEEERPFQAVKTDMFQLFSARGGIDLTKSIIDNSLPIYSFSPEVPGNYLLAMQRNWSFIKLSPKDFEEYLREDGMEYMIAERERLGESQKEARERYVRFIRCLFQVGDKRDSTFKKRTGMRLEIVPLENPYSKKAGDSLKFQIFFDGKPLKDKSVFADNRDGEQISKQKFITDKNGKVSIKLDRKGVWLVRLVFMQRCKVDCGEADWESFWGAFSFGVK